MVTWKISGIYKADAEKVQAEIDTLGDSYQAKDLVEYGRNENTELHKCFEWDDSIAAERYRVQQAEHIMRMLVYVKDEPKETEPVQLSVRTSYNTGEGYVPTRIIMSNPDEHRKLLERALREYENFKKKYAMLSEEEWEWIFEQA